MTDDVDGAYAKDWSMRV